MRLFLSVVVVEEGRGGVGERRGGGRLREEERGGDVEGRVSKSSVFVVEMSVEEEGVHNGWKKRRGR